MPVGLFFDKCAYINFDAMPEIKHDFARTKDPKRLIGILSTVSGVKIEPGNTGNSTFGEVLCFPIV